MRPQTSSGFSPRRITMMSFGHVVLVASRFRHACRPADAAQSHRMANDHRANVADADGRAVAGVHGNGLDVSHVSDQPQPAHHVKFGAVLDVGTAGIAVAVGQGGEDLLQSEVVGLEFGRIHQHLILLGQSAEGIDVHHARHIPSFPSATRSVPTARSITR